MKNSTGIIAVLFCLFLQITIAKSQSKTEAISFLDTVFLINGDILPAKITDTSFFGVKVITQRLKRKEKLIEGERIFSYKLAGGTEKRLYTMDADPNETQYTVEEAYLFMKGGQDAKKKFKSTFTTVSSFAIGAASGGVGLFLSVVPPMLYSGCSMLPKIRIKHNTVSNLNYLDHDTYVLGYEREARKKKLFNSLKGSVTGLAIGFLGFFTYNAIK